MPLRFFLRIMLLGLVPAAPQDGQRPVRVTFEESGDFASLVSRCAERFSIEIPLGEHLPPKNIRIAVRQGGYYEILDALCREHGGVTYFLPEKLGSAFEDGTTVRAGGWVEYPTVYHGEFKVILSHALHTLQRSVSDSGAWTDVGLVAFAPPWLSLCGTAKTHHEWRINEATDMDGKNLLLNRDEGPRSRIHLDAGMVLFGNRAAWSQRLASFDSIRGLRSLSGTVRIEALDVAVARIPLAAGKSTETFGVRITVQSVTKGEGTWRIKLDVEGRQGRGGLREPFETLVRFDGDPAGWRYLLDRAVDSSIAVQTPPLPSEPAWLELRVRSATKREIEFPFRFKNVMFRKDKP